ncbi:MAG: hypothetical protein QW514_06885 [Thermoprotei archaeon]
MSPAQTREHNLVIILVVFAAISPLLVLLNPPFSVPIRVLVSIPTLLFSPGYLILSLKFSDELSRLETLLLSVGLSLAITGVWAVILDELSLPIDPLIVGGPLVLITIILGGLKLWMISQHS